MDDEHFNFDPEKEVLDQLGNLIQEARNRAVALGITELQGDWNVDDLEWLEREFQTKLKAVQRLLRRCQAWEELYFQRERIRQEFAELQDCHIH